MRIVPFVLSLLLFGFASALRAAEPAAPGWEGRLGAFVHDPSSPEKGGLDVNVELVSPRLFSVEPPWRAFVPRAHAGGTMNTTGDTSHAYAGLGWTFDLMPRLFIEGSFGMAIHDGQNGRRPNADRAPLGCSWSFRESASAGWRFTDRLSVMATVEHLSNGGICEENRGLTNFGLRLGYAF